VRSMMHTWDSLNEEIYNVNYIEEDLGVYSIFLEEDDGSVLPSSEPKEGMWHIHFDGACSSEGNGAGIILYSPLWNIHNISYRL